MKNILAISGSIRNNSSNERLLKGIAELYKQDVNIQLFEELAALPFFIPGEGKVPLVVQSFLNKIEKADAVLICSPEYVFSIPGILKNALEWTVATTVFSDKVVGFIVAAASGVKAFDELDLILSTLVQSEIAAERKLLFSGGQKLIDAECKITDESCLLSIKLLVDSLL